jgi:hypothetical protein
MTLQLTLIPLNAYVRIIMQIFKRIIAVGLSALALAGCGNDIDCEPGPGFSKLYGNGGRPSNRDAMEHTICRDSNGNPV